jgi:hypothetical protein
MIFTHPRHPGTPDQNTSAVEQYNLELNRRWTQHLRGDLPGVASRVITCVVHDTCGGTSVATCALGERKRGAHSTRKRYLDRIGEDATQQSSSRGLGRSRRACPGSPPSIQRSFLIHVAAYIGWMSACHGRRAPARHVPASSSLFARARPWQLG